MKRLVVCCDGTWQNLSTSYPTNVVKLTQVIKHISSNGIPQIINYQAGIGTGNEFDRITGGAFGWGIDQEIQDAYRFLSLNYEDGDEIYLFGFSRGAYTVRSLAGFIYNSGLLKPQYIRDLPEAYELYRDRDRQSAPSGQKAERYRREHGENVPIKLLACWDTVGALGIPNTIPFLSEVINTKYKFHDTKVNRQIENALHAVGIDERREVYNVTPMRISEGADTKLRQVWFPGDHGAIGGGTQQKSGLSDGALRWIMDEAQALGLEFVANPETIAEGGINPNYKAAFNNEVQGMEKFMGIIDRRIVNPDNDPTDRTSFDQNFFDQHIHLSTKRRWQLTQAPLYRPNSLKPYKQFFDAFQDSV
ncbi:hypothetical protein NIES4074_58790 [Cylindrospermum sp. NIES-4074]|nr:hypothetical protein NIES4074_58790 [Cylindrospermum sp. NIES-4074]